MNDLLNVIINDVAIDKFLNYQNRLVIQDSLSLSYLVSAAFLKSKSNIAIVANNLYNAQTIYEQISSIIGEDNCLLFPMDEIFHETNYTYSKEILAQRLYVMNRCLDGKKRVLITHVTAATRLLPNQEIYIINTLFLKKGESYSLTNIINSLVNMAFVRVNKLDQSLQFALRGDILDIFPINSERPIRIEFFDDEIESIRYFDIANQTSIEEIDSIDIFPSTDLLIDKNNLIYGNKNVLDKLREEIKDLSYEKRELLTQKVNDDLSKIEIEGFQEYLYKYLSFYQKNLYTIFDYFKSDRVLFYSYEDLISGYEARLKEIVTYLDELHKNGLSFRYFKTGASLSELMKMKN